MSQRICPWWLGYFLANPLRRLFQDPRAILRPWVTDGMTVLEPGPGMGFFTLELARLVGPKGRVVAVDVQPKMLDALTRRAKRAGLNERIETREPRGESLGVDDLAGKVDFVLAFAVVHELPNVANFFAEAQCALRVGGKMLLAEPKHHVSEALMAETISHAHKAGLNEVPPPPVIRGSHSVLLSRRDAG